MLNLKLYGAIAAALAVAGMFAIMKVQHSTIGTLRTEVGTATSQREQAMSANLNQAAALDQCIQSNSQWTSLGKGVAELKADLAALDKARAERDAANRLLTERRHNASVPCKAILATDLTATCSGVIDSLRERATEGH